MYTFKKHFFLGIFILFVLYSQYFMIRDKDPFCLQDVPTYLDSNCYYSVVGRRDMGNMLFHISNNPWEITGTLDTAICYKLDKNMLYLLGIKGFYVINTDTGQCDLYFERKKDVDSQVYEAHKAALVADYAYYFHNEYPLIIHDDGIPQPFQSIYREQLSQKKAFEKESPWLKKYYKNGLYN